MLNEHFIELTHTIEVKLAKLTEVVSTEGYITDRYSSDEDTLRRAVTELSKLDFSSLTDEQRAEAQLRAMTLLKERAEVLFKKDRYAKLESVRKAPAWHWWKTMTPGLVRPFDDYICACDSQIRFTAATVLQHMGMNVPDALSIFSRTGSSEAGTDRRIEVEASGVSLEQALSRRHFFENDYESWANLARLADRPIHLYQGVPPHRTCEAYYVMTVYPEGVFYISPEEKSAYPGDIIRPEQGLSTLAEMINRRRPLIQFHREQE